MELTKTQIKKWNDWVIKCYPEEACAIVKDGKVIIVTNIANNKEGSFEISQEDIIKYKPDAILHSHTYSIKDKIAIDKRTPSFADMKTQVAMGIPWGISETEGDNVSSILWFPQSRDKELLGRRFIFYVDDCYTLLRDYYHQELGIELPYYPKDFDYTDIQDGCYYNDIKSYGFYEVPLADIKKHDILVLSCKKQYDHSAIYIGDNKALNHFWTGLSHEITLGKLSSWITTAIRWEGFKDET